MAKMFTETHLEAIDQRARGVLKLEESGVAKDLLLLTAEIRRLQRLFTQLPHFDHSDGCPYFLADDPECNCGAVKYNKAIDAGMPPVEINNLRLGSLSACFVLPVSDDAE